MKPRGGEVGGPSVVGTGEHVEVVADVHDSIGVDFEDDIGQFVDVIRGQIKAWEAERPAPKVRKTKKKEVPSDPGDEV